MLWGKLCYNKAVMAKGGLVMLLPVSRVLEVEKPGGIDLGQAARYMGARRGADAGTAALLER